jgi:hypothetical protein
MKYAAEMDLDAMIIHTKFHKYWFRRSKLIGGGVYRHTESMEIA